MRSECLASGCVEEVPDQCNECPLSQMGRTLEDYKVLKSSMVDYKERQCLTMEQAIAWASEHFLRSMQLYSQHGNVTMMYQKHEHRIIVVDYRNTYTVQTEYEWEV